MTIELSPAEAGNRAFSEAEHLVSGIVAYCEQPTDSRDFGRPFDTLVSQGRDLRKRLHEVQGLRVTGARRTDAELLAVLDAVDDYVTLAITKMFSPWPKADQVTFRQYLASAHRPLPEDDSSSV